EAYGRDTVDLWSTFEDRMRASGVLSVHYESGVPQAGTAELCLKSEKAERPAFGDLVSQGFMAAVRDNPEFHDADGFVQHCAQSVMPLVYDADAVELLPDRMHGINDLARDFGVTGGVIVPLRGFGEPTFGNVTYIVDRHSPVQPTALPVAELTALAHVLHGVLSKPAPRPSPKARLTEREIACLTHVAEGLSTKRLSHRIGISDATANEHIRNACRKLDAGSRAGAVARAVALGLIRL
ncbi:MAG: LuxR C-terminal-related transcriptional regulator, partial [Pseudomonadota bacterium]